MRLRELHVVGLALLLAGSAAADGTVDFDDRAGKVGASGPCEAQFQVNDEYAGLGIHFSSTDPAVCVLAGASNAPSPPNVVTGIAGGNISLAAPIIATFFDGAVPGTVSSLSVVLTNTSDGSTTVSVFDSNDALLESSTGPGAHSFVFEHAIRSVRIENGRVAADNFSFTEDPPPPVPGPALAAGALLSVLLAAVARARLSR